MNKSRILVALRDAQALNIPFGKKYFHDKDQFCTIGWLVKYAGVPEEDIGQIWLHTPLYDTIIDCIETEYNLYEPDMITYLNDYSWSSWEDAIRYFETLEEV